MAWTPLISPIMAGSVDSDLLKPGVLDEVFGIGQDTVKDGISLMFHKGSMDKNTEYEELLSGPGRFRNWDDDRQGIPYDEVDEVWKAQFGYHWFSNGVIFGKTAKLDLKYNVVEQVVQDFGFMWEVTMQEYCANWLEANAVQTLLDSKAIFATDHPIYGTGGTYPNLIVAQLTTDSLRQGRSTLYMTPNMRGVPMRHKLDRYVCHPNRAEELRELVESPDKPDTPNRAKNTGYRTGIVEEWEFLKDTNAVYLVSDRHRLKFKTRVEKKSQTLFDDETWAMKYQAAGGYGPGLSHWAGIVKISPS